MINLTDCLVLHCHDLQQQVVVNRAHFLVKNKTESSPFPLKDHPTLGYNVQFSTQYQFV